MYRVTLTESHFPAQTNETLTETTVGEALIQAARRAPDATMLCEALADGHIGRRWTNAQLLHDSERLARALATRFAPGERIAVWAPNIPQWVIVEFAAALAGLTLVTVNPGYQAKELDFVLRQSRSSGLFLTRDFRGNPMAEIAAKVCAELPAIRHIVDLEDADALYAADGPARALPKVSPGDPVQIQYTSGTTGFPKGAVLTHRGIVNNSRLCLARLGVREGDSFLGMMPMFHTSGCAVSVLGALQTGCTLYLAKQFDGETMNALIERERIDMLLGVPTMLIAMLEALARNPRDMSSIRGSFSGGAMVPPELARRIFDTYGVICGIVYGQTEASPLLSQTFPDDPYEDQTTTIGQASAHTELSIRDPATNQVVPIGVQGEICARGYCVMLGYNDDPDATAKAIDPDGWLHTGDLGTMDARGYLRITGRVKEMIIRGGENLFPAEIENQMLEHPAIADIAVVGVPDEKWGEIAVCFFRAAPGPAPSRAELVAHCRQGLAAQKTPTHWIQVSAFPLTGSGKIQKFVLREKYLAGEFPNRL
ncbi:MAG TPA: AMP-binding protein [Rhizomicrobium sp.]